MLDCDRLNKQLIQCSDTALEGIGELLRVTGFIGIWNDLNALEQTANEVFFYCISYKSISSEVYFDWMVGVPRGLI